MLDKLIQYAQREFSDSLEGIEYKDYQLTTCKSCGKIYFFENDKVYCREYLSSEDQCCECFLRNNLIEDKDDHILVYHENIGVVQITSPYGHLYAIHLTREKFGKIDFPLYQFEHYLHFFIGV